MKYPLWRITWIIPNNPSATLEVWERCAPTAQDALAMWRAEEHDGRPSWHPDNLPRLKRIEVVEEKEL